MAISFVRRSSSLHNIADGAAWWLGERKGSVRVAALVLIALMAFLVRMFSIVRFESVIHEFDPWFNYRATELLVKQGWKEFINWFDEKAWYPLGRNVGGTLYPGLMVTSAVTHWVLNQILGFPVLVRDVCVFMGPVVSGLTAVTTYFLAKELKNESAGLVSALFMAVCPGYVSRSVAGSYDNEAISIFLMMFTFLMWTRACKSGSPLTAIMAASSYYYMVASWGGYAYIINLIPLHVFVLLAMGRYSHRLYTSYCTFYVLGTVASMTVPFVGTGPIRTSEHIAAFGVFGLLQLVALGDVIGRLLSGNSQAQKVLLRTAIGIVLLAAGLVIGAVAGSGAIAPWAGRFYSLWDPSHAKEHIPIIASVAEHQMTTWATMFFDFHHLLYLFPVGLWYCLRRNRNEHVFGVLYGLTGVYFAAMMVRLELTLAPMICVAAGLGIAWIVEGLLRPGWTSAKDQATQTEVDALLDASDYNLPLEKSPDSSSSHGSSGSPSTQGSADSGSKTFEKKSKFDWLSAGMVLLPLMLHAHLYLTHSVWVSATTYSSPSIVLAGTNPQTGAMMVMDDFREAFYWLRRNTLPSSRVLAWWDYGYQIAGMSERTTIVDNNTWNFRHIALVGKALVSDEPVAYPILRQLDAEYVLVLSGSLSGFQGDDLNKFYWIARIAAGEFPDEVRESSFMNSQGQLSFAPGAPPAVFKSLLYRMANAGFDKIGFSMVDRVRQVPVKKVEPLRTLDEVFSSERFLVRIFRVKQPDALGRAF